MQRAVRFFGKNDSFYSLEEKVTGGRKKPEKPFCAAPPARRNMKKTENGAIGYRTSGSALVDINFSVASMRDMAPAEITERFARAFKENRILAVKWLFYLRDRKEGLGERRSFRICFKYLLENHRDYAAVLMPLIEEYGRFDDLLLYLDSELSEKVCSYFKCRLDEDLSAMAAGKSVSLLAKWLPSPTASSPETRKKAKKTARGLGLSISAYRKLLSTLREYLHVTERLMSDGKWGEIRYEHVPAKANLRYDRAFYRHDEIRREQYLTEFAKNTADIHTAHLMPYEIAHRYMKDRSPWIRLPGRIDSTTELMWKRLLVKGYDSGFDLGRVIVVADGSGSMMTCIGGALRVTALEAAISLAVYFASGLKGAYRDKYITFSEHPALVDLGEGRSLKEKLEIALAHSEVANTNLEAVFDLILNTAVSGQMSQEELPEGILILSDMEFDAAFSAPVSERLMEQIALKYKSHGYELPRLIFWNLCSRTNTIPMLENRRGISLISGFSQNTISMAVREKKPYDALKERLDGERYQAVGAAIEMLIQVDPV